MHRSSVLPAADSAEYPSAPAFTQRESDVIAAWSAGLKRPELHIEIRSDYEFLTEALHVGPGSGAEPVWLVHKTPEGRVAVRHWPGPADIVATLPDALAVIGDAIDRGVHRDA